MAKKRSSKRRGGSPQKQQHRKQEKARASHSRRRRRVFWVVAVVILGAGGIGGFLYADHQRSEAVRDLSAIGNGTPAVVQVHDPTCPVCTELRDSVRAVEDRFEQSELLIRVADITTEEGLAFANEYQSQSITLVFLDGDGNRVTSVSGQRSPDQVRDLFERHIAGEL
ncbi:MAG: thioredoxin family protein [Spirochaetales bacterium]